MDNINSKSPVEAFSWLIEQFQAYAHGKLIWLDVREVLAVSRAVHEKFVESLSNE